MKQTEHYGLNQWELTDRVLMADFNADNAKIEAALGKLAKRPAYELSPLYMVIPYPLNTCVLNNRHLPWEELSVVHYIINILADEENPIVCLAERHTGGVIKELGDIETNQDPENRMKQTHLIFYPMYDKTRPAEALVMGMGETHYINFGISFEQLPDLEIHTKQVGSTRPHGMLKGTFAYIYTQS